MLASVLALAATFTGRGQIPLGQFRKKKIVGCKEERVERIGSNILIL